MTTPAKVKKTSTKDKIYTAYEKTLAELAEAKAVQLDPTQIKKEKRRTEVIEATKDLNLDMVQKSIETLRNRTSSVLNDLTQQLETEISTLRTVEEAIRTREEETKEVFGIERQAESLAALIQAQEEQELEFRLDLTDRQDVFDEEMIKARKTWNEERADHERQFQLKVQLDQEERDRELETHKYTFSRSEKERLDQLTDRLSSERKEYLVDVELMNKALKEREETVAKSEFAFTELQTQVETLKAQLTVDIEFAIEKTKKDMNASKAIATNSIERECNAKLTVLQGTADGLTRENDRLISQVAALETKLEAAYEKVQGVAVAALNSQGSANTVAQIQSAVSAATSGKR